MLHVILQILSVIGIVLLSLLGVLLLLILLVLFVPVRYKLKGHKEGDALWLQVRVTYLLHLLSARADYPEPGNLTVKFCGIKLFDSSAKKPPKQEKGKEKENQATAPPPKGQEKEPEPSEDEIKRKETGMKPPENEPQPPEDEIKRQETGTKPSENESQQPEAGSKQPEADSRQERTESQKEPEQPEKSKKSRKSHRKTLKERIREIFEKIKYTILSVYDKIKNGLQKAEELKATVVYYKNTLEAPQNRRFFKRVKKRVFRILKSIRPKVLKADLHIGTGSPDTTGYLCAVYGMLSPLLGNNVNLAADFENTVWEGHVDIKGNIVIFTVLWHVLCVVLDKQLRTFVKEMKREEK